MAQKFFIRGLAGRVVSHMAENSYHDMNVSTLPRQDFPLSPIDAHRTEQPMVDAFCYKSQSAVYEVIMRQYPALANVLGQNYSFSLLVQREDGKDDGLVQLAAKLREETIKGEFLHKHEKRMMNGIPSVNFSPGFLVNLDPKKFKIRKPGVKLDMYFSKLPDEETLFWVIYRGAISPLMKIFRSL